MLSVLAIIVPLIVLVIMIWKRLISQFQRSFVPV